MEKATSVYWKRHPDADKHSAISGWCVADDVPSYGEVKSEPLPTEIAIVESESDAVTDEIRNAVSSVRTAVNHSRLQRRFAAKIRFTPQSRNTVSPYGQSFVWRIMG